MKKYDNLVKNAAGRMVPTIVNGHQEIPFQGIGKHRPSGRKYAPPIPTVLDYPADGNKEVASLEEALRLCGLRDGMTISTHHHLRDGDLIANQVFEIAHRLKVKNLVWLPSASFPCHDTIIHYLENGTIDHIEGSMNGPLGQFTTSGKMKGCAVLRSHGGRAQAIQDGEVHIDIAILATPTADPFGNGNAKHGPSACGVLGYSLADYLPTQIEGSYVDFVVKVDKIGIPEKIVSGTTRITKSPDRLLIAEMTARFCLEAGLLKDGCSFQAGAGGTSLAVEDYFHKILLENKWKARFCFGGSTEYMVKMLEDGSVEYILDAQAFDLEAVRSISDNPSHCDVSVFHAYNFHSKGNYAGMTDIVILGATEIDVNFNGNVVTHSDGHLLHGIGGWQNCLYSKCTIIPVPLFRDRIPVIVDEVTTLCGPGSLIDVIVTERGIAINPLRTDLIEKMKGTKLPIKDIKTLKEEAEFICGKPSKPHFTNEVVGIIKWVDGTVIDTLWKVED
jgi:citrate lyase subunit alpha/citrate CoA-transferase